jgi:epoxide hydrolase-like predicted phosphatase
MSRSFDAVLFDFGGVFTDSPFEAFEAAAAEIGAPPEQILPLVFGSYDEDTDHPWHRLERGEITIGDARDAILQNIRREGLDFDPIQVLVRMGGGGGARPALVDRVHALRAEGYRTALVTNNVLEFREHWRKLVPVETLFDTVIDSSEEGIRKPDPAIYHLSLERVGGVAPERALFLDDYPGNVAAASALGMSSILVTAQVDDAIAELDRRLGAQRR